MPTIDLSWLKALILPQVLTALVYVPYILQLAKGYISGFDARWASALSAVSAIGLVIFVARPAVPGITWLAVAGQCAIAVVFSDQFYVRVLAPLAASRSPIVPDTKEENKSPDPEKGKR